MKEPLKTAPKTPQPQVLNMDMETFYVIKTDEEMSMAYKQDIELSQEQLNGCVKLLYAMNRAGFDLSKLKIVKKTLDKNN